MGEGKLSLPYLFVSGVLQVYAANGPQIATIATLPRFARLRKLNLNFKCGCDEGLLIIGLSVQTTPSLGS